MNNKPLCNGKSLKLLAITSSFGMNTTQFLYEIALSEGYTDVVVGRLYSSGCSLKRHAERIDNQEDPYEEYTKISTADGQWTKSTTTTLLDGILDEDWDIIFIQQSASQAGLSYTYYNYIDKIVEYVNRHKTNPNAKFVWNVTWAYQSDSQERVFLEEFKSDQMYMYQCILEATKCRVLPLPYFDRIVPTGTAIQNARTSFFGDALTKDTYHLNNLGRAIAGYTLFSVITGKPLTRIELPPVNSYDVHKMLVLTEADKKAIMEAVNNAIASPFEITQAQYKQNEGE